MSQCGALARHTVDVRTQMRFGRYCPSSGVFVSAGTFDVQRLRQYMDLGVNRFSIGVQASLCCVARIFGCSTPCAHACYSRAVCEDWELYNTHDRHLELPAYSGTTSLHHRCLHV